MDARTQEAEPIPVLFVRLIERAAFAVEEWPRRVLIERKPEWDEGLNCDEINRLARQLTLVGPEDSIIEPGESGVRGDPELKRWVVIHHPDLAQDPVFITTYEALMPAPVSTRQADRVARSLREWAALISTAKWLKVTDAGKLLMKDLPVLKGKLGKAKARVSRAAGMGKFKTNGRTGFARRIDAESFAVWRLQQRDLGLDAEDEEDEPTAALPRRRYGTLASGARRQHDRR